MKSAVPNPADLEFKSGDLLQVALLRDPMQMHHELTVIGCVRERSLLLRSPQKTGYALALSEGAAVSVRLFVDGHALGFQSTVLRVCQTPYHYLHLAYPNKIEPLQERKTSRVRSALAATVRRPGSAPGDEGTPAIIRDVSANGALLFTPDPVGVEGDALVIRTRFPLDQLGDQPADIPVTIKNAQDEAPVAGSPWRNRYGVEFGVPDSQATLILRAYLYERFTDF